MTRHIMSLGLVGWRSRLVQEFGLGKGWGLGEGLSTAQIRVRKITVGLSLGLA